MGTATIQTTSHLDQRRGMVAPDRSVQQRMEALQRANQVRIGRAQLKRDMKAGRRTVAELLREPPEFIGTMKVHDLLLARPKFGRVKVNDVLRRARISPSRTVGGLSPRQREELVRMLRRR